MKIRNCLGVSLLWLSVLVLKLFEVRGFKGFILIFNSNLEKEEPIFSKILND